MSDQSGGRRKRGRSGTSGCGRRLRPRKAANKGKGRGSPMVIVDEREGVGAGAGPAPVPVFMPPDEQEPEAGETDEAALALTAAAAGAEAAAAAPVHAEAAAATAPAVAAMPVHAIAATAAAAAAAAVPVHATEAAAPALVAAASVPAEAAAALEHAAAAPVAAAVHAAAVHAAAVHAAAAAVFAPAASPAVSCAASSTASLVASSVASSAASPTASSAVSSTASSVAAPPVSWLDSGLGSNFNAVLVAAHSAKVSEGGGGGEGYEEDEEDGGEDEGDEADEGGQKSNGNDGSALKACFALDALRFAPPSEVDRLKAELEKEEAMIETKMLAEQKEDLDLALWLGNLRNAKPYCLATCRIELTEEDAFVQPGVTGLCRLRATRKATVTKWGKQLLAERRILQKKKRARRASKSTTKTEAEDEWSYLTCGPPEWYVRAKAWRSAEPMSLEELERASRPAPAGSSEQAEGGTAPLPASFEQTAASRPAPAQFRGSRGAPAASCGQAARWTAPFAQPCRQAVGSPAPRTELDGRGAIRRSGRAVYMAESTRGQGMERNSQGVKKNEDYEAFLAEQRVLFEMAKDEMLEERREIRKAWEGPGAQAYEQLAAEIGRKGGSEADFLEAKAAVDDNIKEWERQEFVAACGGRGRLTARPVFGEALDGGTASTLSDGLGGGVGAAAGGGVTGIGLMAGGEQEDAAAGNGKGRPSLGSNASASSSSAGGTDGEASDESPVRMPHPPSVDGLGKRKRQVEATESRELEEPED